ncbi:thrombospondin type 3 repeat-containing protein [Nocardioides currus]|nr:thrombospondin type 3 repeat-containing protein [Nocardioides currus]
MLLALLVTVSSLVVVSGSTAQAAPAPCVVTYQSAAGGAIPANPAPGSFGYNFFDIVVPDARIVADVDFSMDVTVPNGAEVSFRLVTPEAVNAGTQGPLAMASGGLTTGPLNAAYTFDDEATTAWSGASPPAGRYKPFTPLTALETKPAAGTWRLHVGNTNASPGTLRSFSITLTFTTCDTDGDGIEDRVDNCPVANADQADLDADAFGNACDVDVDGDLVLDDVDGCATTAGRTATGCPSATRTAALARRRNRLVTTVASTVAGCRADAEVTVWRKKKGRDARIVLASTDTRGKASTRAPRRAGRYYVTVASSYAAGQAECGAARSRVVKVRRR